MYIKNLIREIKTWNIVRKTAKENKGVLNKIGYDVDWVGRIYTVMNIPEELANLSVKTTNGNIAKSLEIDYFVKDNMKEVADLLTELRIIDLVVFPEYYEKLGSTNSILVVLKPDRVYFTLFKFGLFLLFVFGAIFSFLTIINSL